MSESTVAHKRNITTQEFELLGLEEDALFIAAQRHEETLNRINIEPLEGMQGITAEYLYWFKHLFLLTFFYDYCLDRSYEEQFPEAFFISANMYNEYKNFVLETYGQEGLTKLDKNVILQLRYQMIEKQWANPLTYSKSFPNYDNYYLKQVLCLTHLELLGLKVETQQLASKLISHYKAYWSLILLIDDYMDIEKDLYDEILTPIIADYRVRMGRNPKVFEVDGLRKRWTPTIKSLFAKVVESSSVIGISGTVAIAEAAIKKEVQSSLI